MDITIEYNPQTKVLCRKEKHPIKPNVLGKMLFDKMKSNKDSVSQIYAPTGEFDTFDILLQKCIRTAITMKNLGLKQGDIISLCTYNHLNAIVPYIAAQFLGVIVAPLNPLIELEDIKYLLNMVKPVMIFISDNCENWIEDAVENCVGIKIITFGNCSKFFDFNDFIEPVEGEAVFEPPAIKGGDETVVILFTSGTTGYPKGIQLSHNCVLVNIYNLCGAYESAKDKKVILNYSTLNWISPLLTFVACIHRNITRLLCKQFEAHLFWKYVEQYQVNFVSLLPFPAVQIYNLIPIDCIPSCLKCISIGGYSISPVYLEGLKKALPTVEIVLNYGLTETGTVIVDFLYNKLSKSKSGTIGYPMPEFQFKIVDSETGRPLGFNQVGELRINPNFLMKGYYNIDSSDCFDKDGFFKTGDELYYDEDFYFYFSDRIKEMFKYRGWHIIPAKLEAILEQHVDVQFAVVIGIPHKEDNSHAMGIVVLHEGKNTTGTELEEFVNEQVKDQNKLRAGVRILKSLPYTTTGKIARNVIRKMMISETNLS